MSSAFVSYYECDTYPTSGAERLDIVEISTPPEIDWGNIDQAVQDVFARLAQKVQASWPEIRSHGGKTRSHLLLFSYRVFELRSDSSIDPVVAGVDFAWAPSGRRMVVRADLCGEETGQVWFELAEREVFPTQEVLRVNAVSLAERLSEQSDRIRAALSQPRLMPPK